jgi:hypothetical protein
LWVLLVAAVIIVPSWVQALPVPSHLADQVAPNAGDPLFITWVLGWETHALVHDPGHLFAGNIFYPRTDSIAWSDNLVAAVPIFAAVRWLSGGRLILAYNLVTLAGFSAVGYSTYALAKRLVRNRQAALISGSLCSLSAARSFSVGHTQFAGFCFVPLALLGAIAFLDSRQWRYAVGLGLAVAATWLMTAYLTILVVLVLLAFFLVWLLQRRLRAGPRFYRGLALAGACAALIVSPTLPLYIRLQRDHLLLRSASGQQAPRWSDIVWKPPSLLYRWWTHASTHAVYGHPGLFPGAVLSGLLVVGVAGWAAERLARRRRIAARSDSGGQDTTEASGTYVLPIAAGVVPAVMLMLGPSAQHHLYEAFDLLRATVPGVASLRQLDRFWIYVVMCGALAAGAGAKRILDLAGRRRGPVLTAAVLVLVWLELLFRPPTATVDLSARATAANRALAAAPPGAVLELPEPLGPSYPYVTALRMVRSLDDYHPRIDGYSGGLPPQVSEWERLASRLAPARLVPYLRSYGVRYMLVHHAARACVSGYSDAELSVIGRSLRREPGVQSIEEDGDGFLVTLSPAPVDRGLLPSVAPGRRRSSICS